MSIDSVITAVGVVVIGRNEGDRLKVCLESLRQFPVKLVYVDSGSTDDSVALATKLGADVVNLDMNIPFTAARARNEGFARLMQTAPACEYVQFVDGDCEVVNTWFAAALNALQVDNQLAVVCGRRKERYPEKTFYNYMCDLEWNTPIGEAKACGGDALMKVSAFQSVDGYNNGVIAGEEPELCVRLRAKGWKIARINEDMTIHDAAMTRFSQWWKRSVRAGHAYAQGYFMHGRPPEQHKKAETKRAWLWALYIPLAIILLGFVNTKIAMLALMIYPLQWLRLAYKQRQHGWGRALRLAAYSLVGKFAELSGQLKFHKNRLSKKHHEIIEYK